MAGIQPGKDGLDRIDPTNSFPGGGVQVPIPHSIHETGIDIYIHLP